MMLEVQCFSVKAGNHTILSDVSFTVGEGEKIAVMGLSGSGKSTLLENIGGLQRWNNAYNLSGHVFFQGKDVVTMSQPELSAVQGQHLGFIFQEPMSCFNPVKRIGMQMVSAFRKHHPKPEGEIKEMVLSWFKKIHLPSPEKAFVSYPHQLSGGQLQRIMTVFAVMHSPRLILADEPVSALDVDNKKILLDILESERNNNHSAILMVTHDVAFAKSWADRLIILQEGHIVETGTPDVLSNRSVQPFTRSLFSFENKRKGLDSALLAPEKQKIDPHSTPALDVHALTKSYFLAGFTMKVLNNIQLQLHPGKIMGITGHSGCGKSTLARCVLRLDNIDSGTISWFGKDVSQLDFNALRPLRKKVQIVFQDTNLSLPPHLTVRDILSEAIKISGNESPDPGQIFSVVGLEKSLLDRFPPQLSGGQRQRVSLARALVFRPDLLILDEVISMLDPVTQLQIVELLLKINKENNTALLFITHDREWLYAITKDIIEM